jgi:heat shock protein HslJ
MKKLIVLLNTFIIINSILASGKKTDDIRGKWYLKTIVIDGVSRSPGENISPYIYFRYDSTNRFYHNGFFYVVNGNGNFKESYPFQNFYQIKDDTLKLVGPRLIGHFGIKGATFDLRNELHGAFKYSISSNNLLLENKEISLYYEKDSVINHGLEKASKSPDFGFDKKLIGSWRLVKMNVPDSLVEEVNRSIEKAYEKKRNRGFPQKKRPKKLIEMGKQKVQRFLKDGGWTVNIGDFVENTNSHDTLSYGNFISYSDGCNGCRGYIKVSNETLKINNIMCTAAYCFPNFTGTFKNHSAFNNATYQFKSDTLIIEATSRTSFFVQSGQTASAKNDYKSFDKFYKLADLSIENKELEKIILNLIPENQIYFHLSGGWGINPKNNDCSGNKMEIFLYNNEHYYMQDLMWVYHENFGELQDRFNYNCAFIRNEHEINKYIDMKELLGEKYIFKIEENNLTFRSPDNRNFLYLKSDY